MFANTKDRRLSRHGSNIIESEERDQIGSGLLRKSKTFFRFYYPTYLQSNANIDLGSSVGSVQ